MFICTNCVYNFTLQNVLPFMGDRQTHICEDYLRNCSDAASWNFNQKLASQCCGFCTGEYFIHTTADFL